MAVTDTVTRLIELYTLLLHAPGTPSWRAEQMRLLTCLSTAEQTSYYRAIAQYHRAPEEEILEWP